MVTLENCGNLQHKKLGNILVIILLLAPSAIIFLLPLSLWLPVSKVRGF